jgi:hypothetical protein
MPIAVRYITTNISPDFYNVVFFGFPLYYMQRPMVDSAFVKALRDVGQ